MRISDWSSDVCSSDLTIGRRQDWQMAREDRSMPYGVVHSTVGEVLGRHAVSRGEKTFLSFEGRDFTYAFADRHSNRVANGLRDKVKVGKGDHEIGRAHV